MYSEIDNGASIGPFMTNSDKMTKIGIFFIRVQQGNKCSN